MRHGIVIAIACVISCSPFPTAASPSASAALRSTALPSPAKTTGSTSTVVPTQTVTQRTFATVCGRIADFAGDSASTAGSFVLTSPDRDPLKLTIPAGRLGGSAAGYVCVNVLRGNPNPLFDGFIPGGVTTFIREGDLPATSADPAPTGFVLPQACAYVAAPVVTASQTDWLIECGPTRDRDARGTLAPELSRQGWTPCGSGLASASWRKSGVLLAIAESSLAPGDYPRITQSAAAC